MNDRYRKSRGGYSRLLALYCAGCTKYLLQYQKDGTGSLKRLYLDRIVKPSNLLNNKSIKCSACKRMIGTLYKYKKENRPAFRLYQDAVSKKIVKV